MGSKRQNADVFARLAEGLAARGHPACTPDHVRSKVKELRQGYARADLGPPPPLAPFTGSSGKSWAPGTPPPPLATLDTSADESQQVPETESTPEASPAPQGAPPGAHPGTQEEEEEASSDGGLLIDLPFRSSSRASTRWVFPDRGTGPSAAPSEGPESTGAASVVPESPLGPSQQASPSAEHGPAPGRSRQQRSHPQASTDSQLLATLRCQLEVCERRLQVEEPWLHLQERVLAWRQEAWGAFTHTFQDIARHLAPPPLRPPLHLPLRLPSLHHQPSWGLPPRGTMGLRTPPGPICRFSRPPPSLDGASGPDVGRAPPHQALDNILHLFVLEN
ncbi:uncharacterized protein LOC142015818 [Carettochelys insculpta]|uniref:uncharacterized protein LOC142015818 n=1 Tax=Carettochelys insculpta TaxID=44489 RepID=UPI003EB91956